MQNVTFVTRDDLFHFSSGSMFQKILRPLSSPVLYENVLVHLAPVTKLWYRFYLQQSPGDKVVYFEKLRFGYRSFIYLRLTSYTLNINYATFLLLDLIYFIMCRLEQSLRSAGQIGSTTAIGPTQICCIKIFINFFSKS